MNTKKEQQEARERLLKWLKPGDNVYCCLKHVSRSGMLRVIQLVIFHEGEPCYLGWNAADLLGWSYDRKREGVRVSGCGMDMGFHLVYSLAHCLWPDGWRCIGRKRRCPSADHLNGDRSYRRKHHDGGYALRSAWL